MRSQITINNNIIREIILPTLYSVTVKNEVRQIAATDETDLLSTLAATINKLRESLRIFRLERQQAKQDYPHLFQ